MLIISKAERVSSKNLTEFLKDAQKSLILNMLLAEYDYGTDIAVQRAEEREIAFAKGIEQGIQQGIAQGTYRNKLETAKT